MVLGCDSSSDNNDAQPQSLSIDFVTLYDLDAGAETGAEPKRTVVIADQATYESQTARYHIQNPTTVDFSSHKVLLVDMGAKPTGGHSLEVVDVFTDNESVVAQVDFISPGEDCAVTQAFSQPVIFVEINSRDEIMVNETTRREDSCEN